jgi:hypothetical protein
MSGWSGLLSTGYKSAAYFYFMPEVYIALVVGSVAMRRIYKKTTEGWSPYGGHHGHTPSLYDDETNLNEVRKE